MLKACKEEGLSNAANSQIVFPQLLSAYHIFEGKPSDLIPSPDYHLYQLGSTLFTDFAEKQRLIKLPAGTQMKLIDDDLPYYPDGTIIVKTFYYFHDKRDPSQGKRIIETQLLVKEDGAWNVADYLWNEDQTDAVLIEDGLNTTVNYINKIGQPKVLAYRVPSNRECATCHSKNDKLIPIGPKLRNLNIDIETDFGKINQLSHFQNLGLLEDLDHTAIFAMPDFHDTYLSIEQRARAYMDINCGHCHNQDAVAASTDLFMLYEIPLEASNIKNRKGDTISNIEKGKMPYLGTTVLDEEGIELIKAFLNSL